MATAFASVNQQISELQEFGVTYQAKFKELQSVVKDQQEEILNLKKQVLDLSPINGAISESSARMPLPQKFNGDRRLYRGFLNQCRIYFQMQPAAFSSERKKVLFIINLLTEEALSWASPYVEKDDIILDNLHSFIKAMDQVFDDPNRCATAEAKLHNLRQGRRSVAEYTTEFRRWIADTTWNPAAQRSQFRQGLSEQIKDELARGDTPDDLENFIQLCIRIDQRLSERRKERLGILGNNEGMRFSFSQPPRKSSQVLQDSNNPEPMQIDSIRRGITMQEKERRRIENLCLYCGDSGHYAINCPNKLRRTVAATDVKDIEQISSIAQSVSPVLEKSNLIQAPPTHFMISIQLSDGANNISCSAMLDSGAGGNFMDIGFAQDHHIELRNKSLPVDMETVDGSPLSSGPITHETAPLSLFLEPDHQETICFQLISSPKFPIILGIPWFSIHNPSINWETRVLTFASEYCKGHCQPKSSHVENLQVEEHIVSGYEGLPPQYREFNDVCDKKNADLLPPHRPYDCPIELLPGAEIPFGRLYSMSEPELKVLREWLDENLAKGFIRHSTSPAGAALFFVEKKDKTLRPCVDYRELNKITVKNRYPLPLIPELLERLRSAKIFTKLDLRGAYNLIRIRKGDEWKTAFRTRYGHFESLVMPFGLCNAPATFQHFINDVLRDLLDQFVIAYLDDILIFSDSLQEHRKHVSIIFERLRKNRLYIKLEKCEFEQTKIQFLGYIISPEGLSMDPDKIKAVVEWPAPRNIKEIQRFLGFANFYRKFIRDFSKVVAPITQLTKKGQLFTWSPEAQAAFSKLKTLFTSAPILVHPDPELPFVVEVDASDSAVGAILSQRIGEKMQLHPCAYFSRLMSSAERNYDIGNKELLAIKEAFSEWRHLLEGAKHLVTVLTDHRNLEFIRSVKRLSSRQARWSLFFSRFNFIVSYRPGSRNGKADALSRSLSESPQGSNSDGTILSQKNFLGATNPKEFLTLLKDGYSSDPLLKHPPKDLSLTFRNGFWIQNHCLYVPQSARIEVLRLVHDSKLAGHFGAFKTAELLSRSFWWPSYKKDVKNYVASCPTCARHKTPRSSPVGLLQPLPIPSRPWGSISMDFVVELPPSKEMTTILVVVDRLTKMAHFIPTKGVPTAEKTAELMIREVFRLHGIPDNVVSDRGVQFTSKFWRSFCMSLGVTVNLSSAFHPQSNGQTERTNQTLEQYLRCFVSYLQDDWVDYLPTAEFAYNNSKHSSTSLSPFYVNSGYHPVCIPDLPIATPIPAVNERLSLLQETRSKLLETLKVAQEAYKKASDRRRRAVPSFRVGDKVWLSAKNLKTQVPSVKLGPKYLGPFQILAQVNAVTFRLKLPDSMRIHPVFHVSLLKPFHENSFPGRVLPPPPPVVVEGEEEFIVEGIIDSRIYRNKLQYLVKWEGYGPEENSWEPAEHVHAPRLVQEFHQRFPLKPGPKTPCGRPGRRGILSGPRFEPRSSVASGSASSC